MNAVEFIAALINIMVSCSALPIHETRLGQQDYQVQNWVCQVESGPIAVHAWRRPCDTGHTKYWGRLFFLEIGDTDLYLSKFGEVMVGQGVQLEDTYIPTCGV